MPQEVTESKMRRKSVVPPTYSSKYKTVNFTVYTDFVLSDSDKYW